MSAVQPPFPDAAAEPILPSRADARSDQFLLGFLGLAVALHFVVRGWLGASLVVGGLIGLWQCLVHRAEALALLRDRRVAWMLAALAAPFAAALLVSLVHGNVVGSRLDSPLRLVLAALLMLELARRGLKFARIAQVAVPVALLALGGWIFLVPEARHFFWEGRFATYYMDPLMLSLHALIAAFVCLFLPHPPGRVGMALLALKLLAAVVAVLVALGTQSRTGWVIVPALGLLWFVRAGGKVTWARLAAGLAVVLGACFLAYLASPVVRLRVDQAVEELGLYLRGEELETSIGLRLSLFRVALLMFAERPGFGWGLGPLPDLLSYAPAAGFYSAKLDYYFVTAGVHNEFLQAMMRMGTAGLVAKLLLYAVPLVLFLRALRSPDPDVRTHGYLGLVVVVGYLAAGMSSEVTNLIYAGSFYGFLVAVFAAGVLRERSP